MPTTPGLALRYPASGDADNVPLDLRRLAEDVENNGARGEVSRAVLDSDITTSATTELLVDTCSEFLFVTTRLYEITISGSFFGTVAADEYDIRLRQVASGTVRYTENYYVPAVGTAGANRRTVVGLVEGGWAGTYSPVLTLKRNTGSGVLTAKSGLTVIIKDISPA